MSGAQPYDPYNPFSDDAAKQRQDSGSPAGTPTAGASATKDPHSKLHNLQDNLNETAGIMRNNLEAMNRRGETLEDMDARADDLNNNTKMFSRRANEVRRSMWKKNMKLKICVAIVVVVLLVVIIVPIVVEVRR